MNCEFCNKLFSTKSNLICHQKTAKYCLKLREESLPSGHRCEYCKDNFLRKSALITHLDKCKLKKEKDQIESLKKIKNDHTTEIKNIHNLYKSQIDELKKQILDLQNKNQELALKAIEKPTTITNNNNKLDNHSITNTYNHLQPLNLSHEHLYQILDQNLKIEHIYQGQVGLANVVADKLLTDVNGKPLAFCNDKSRQIIKYKNEGGEIIKDVKAYNLVSSIAPIAEEIAIKRKREFENKHYPKKEQKKEETVPDEIYFEDEEDSDYIGFEDESDEEEEFNKTITIIQNEKNVEKKKEQVENIIKEIDKKEDWDEGKKTYYFNKLIKGITDLQILNVNPTLFSKQLSMILPSDVKNSI